MGSNVSSKALFALRQLCVNSQENKKLVGDHCVKKVVTALKDPANLARHDWATNALMLLLLLSVRHENCLYMQQTGWDEVVKAIDASQLGSLEGAIELVKQVSERISNAWQKS